MEITGRACFKNRISDESQALFKKPKTIAYFL